MAKSKSERLTAKLIWLQEYAPDLYERLTARIRAGKRGLSISGTYALARKGLGNVEFIYLVEPLGGGGPVKVGCTVDPHRRLQQLQMFSPVELVLLGFVPGNRAKEKRLHRQMRKHRAWGEWFRWNEVLEVLLSDAMEYKAGFEPSLKAAIEANKKPPRAA